MYSTLPKYPDSQRRDMDYRLLFTACLLFHSLPLEAAVYQWTDEQGRMHFSDRRGSESAVELKLPADPPHAGQEAIPAERQQRRQRMLDVYEQERMEKREAEAKEKRQRELRQRRCLKARTDYEGANRAGSLYEHLQSGERRFLGREERERYIARLKAEVERYCR